MLPAGWLGRSRDLDPQAGKELGSGSKRARDRVRARFAELHQSLACGHDERIAQALEPYLKDARRHADAALRG